MAQQTAVKWLLQQLILNGTIRLTYTEHPMYKELSNKAKEMEKQQIIDAWQNAIQDTNYNILDGEDYYNETYKQ